MGGRGGEAIRAALVGVLLATACGDDSMGQAWDPPAGTSTDDADTGAEPGTGSEGAECSAAQTQPCLCPDGLSLGEQACGADGVFGTCECGDEGSDGSTGDPMPPLPAEVCYLGADAAGTTCLPLQAFYAELPAGYEYPPPMLGNGQDRPPLGLIDVQAADGTLALAPNFALDELAQPANGQWAVIQPHAVVSLQAMRDQAGAIAVLAGYLSPSANAAQGGELYARHQWGDGFDLEPLDTTVPALADLCTAQGGAVVSFETHLHCELSSVPLDEAFFGPATAAARPDRPPLQLDAWIEPDGHVLWAPALGFSEGEPTRQWTARDARGEVLATARGRSFEPPPGTVEVEVLVGSRVLRALDLGR